MANGEIKPSLIAPPIYPIDFDIGVTKQVFRFQIHVDGDSYYRFVLSPEWAKIINLVLTNFVKHYEEKVRKLNVSLPKPDSPTTPIGFLKGVQSTAVLMQSSTSEKENE